jgi:hypothetical protein
MPRCGIASKHIDGRCAIRAIFRKNKGTRARLSVSHTQMTTYLLTSQCHDDMKMFLRKIWKGVRQLLRTIAQLDRETSEWFRKKLGNTIVVVVVRYWNGIIQL